MRRTLEADDVVFMYSPRDETAYDAYGATVLAWGGAHTRARADALRAKGIHATGTMWCLTANPKRLHEDADLRDAVCRDPWGEPIVVPWLRHTEYQGTPRWFGCTRHPAFRAHVRANVCRAMGGGADGLHVDDPLGSAHPAIRFGGCFCRFCVEGFREHLRSAGRPDLLEEAGGADAEGFDYAAYARSRADSRDRWIETHAGSLLHEAYVSWQLAGAVEHLRQLHRLAEEIVAREVSLSANATLPRARMLPIAACGTYIVCEVAHHAEAGTARLADAVLAYRMADALGKPMAATPEGKDWARVKAEGRETLARVWIALAYACGQRLMAPQSVWSYTEAEGSDYYHGPAEAYAPLYRFVRDHADLFRGFRAVGSLAAALRSETAEELVDSNVQDRFVAAVAKDGAEPLEADGMWVFPRRHEDGRAAVHLVNLAYRDDEDRLVPRGNAEVRLPGGCLDGSFRSATLYAWDAAGPQSIEVEATPDGLRLAVPRLKTWGVVLLEP